MPEETPKTEPTVPSTSSQTRPLSPIEIGNIAEGIERVWGEDQEYRRIFEQEVTIVDTVLKELAGGRINQEEATRILAARGAESRVANGLDGLMDIPNRGELDRKLLETIATAKRYGHRIAVGFADLDDFKGINDAPDVQHDGGDAVLRAWGQSIKTGLRRDIDFVGRYGGEEILFVFPNTEESWAAEHLRGLSLSMGGEIEESVSAQGFNLPYIPTMTVGVVDEKIDPKDPREPEEIMANLVRRADERMYLGKRNGKKMVVDTAVENQLRQTG